MFENLLNLLNLIQYSINRSTLYIFFILHGENMKKLLKASISKTSNNLT